MLGWNITNLRSQILDGKFQHLKRDDCIAEYANSYVSGRGTVVAVPHEPITAPNNKAILLAGYGYPGGTAALNPSHTKFNHNETLFKLPFLDPNGHEWMCFSIKGQELHCSGAFLQKSDSWTVLAQPWVQLIEVTLPAFVGPMGYTWDYSFEKSVFEANVQWEYPDAPRKEVEAFASYVQSNPLPEQMWAYINSSSWITPITRGHGFPPLEPKVRATCPREGDLDFESGLTESGPAGRVHPTGRLQLSIDYCLSQKVREECRLFFHLPIAVVVIICSSIKMVCIWVLLRTDRRDLFLTIGDAISSFLQRPHPTTKYWCTLSPGLITVKKDYPWNPESRSSAQDPLVTRTSPRSTP